MISTEACHLASHELEKLHIKEERNSEKKKKKKKIRVCFQRNQNHIRKGITPIQSVLEVCVLVSKPPDKKVSEEARCL